MSDDARQRLGAAVRRYLPLALFVAVMMSPSVAAAAGLVAGAALLAVAPALLRSGRRRWRRAGAVPDGAIDLGVDAAGRRAVLTADQLAAHALIAGASGAGKSTTLLTILSDHIGRGLPVVAIDMKGSPGFADGLRRAAAAAGRELRVWTLDGSELWNPLGHGNPTALKDKLISTERFTEPHYQRAAERYVQTALQVIAALHPHQAPTLNEVVAFMEPNRLRARLRHVPSALAERVQDYLAGLTPDQLSAVRGLATRLAVLSESSAGRFLHPAPGERAIDLRAGLDGGDVILFSLNSSVYGGLAAQVGALAIQDLTAAAGERLARGGNPPPAIVAVDEFSALGADNILALLARGREPGVRILLATQEMADIERAGRGFLDQVLGIIGVKIAHRQDVPDSARLVAEMIGTERVWERTEQLRSPFGAPGASRGTRRLVERFVVHPNVIKTLEPGQAVVLTKLPRAAVARVQVRPPAVRALERPRPQEPPHRHQPPHERPNGPEL